MQEIVLYGASGHGSVLLDIIEKSDEFSLVGVVDDGKSDNEFYGYPLLGGMDELVALVSERNVAVAVGVGELTIREKLVAQIRSRLPECSFPALVHPEACLAKGVTVGAGSVVCGGVVVNTAARIGEFCIINTSAVVEHDCVVGDYSMLNPRSVIGGECHVADRVMIGLGAGVIHGITVNKGAVVGSGAMCVKDVDPYTVVMGVPAKAARTRTATERYL